MAKRWKKQAADTTVTDKQQVITIFWVWLVLSSTASTLSIIAGFQGVHIQQAEEETICRGNFNWWSIILCMMCVCTVFEDVCFLCDFAFTDTKST